MRNYNELSLILKERDNIARNFIYFVLGIWLASEVLLNSTIETIFIWEAEDVNKFMAWLILMLLLVQIVFFQRYQVRELVIIAIVTIPIVIATLNSSYNIMMSTWIFVVASKYIDFDKLVEIAYFVQIIMVALVFFLFFTGVIDEYTMYRGSTLRHSLGFSHPNHLGVRIFQLVVCRCYLRRNKLGVSDIIIVLLAGNFVNVVSNSKTAYYALLIFTIMIFLHIILSKKEALIERVISYTIVVAVAVNVLSVILSIIDVKKYSILNLFDRVMSSRFSKCHKTVKYYGVPIWGQDVQKTVKRHIIGSFYNFWLDNAYMSILLRYGVVVFLIFSILYIAVMIYLKKEKQYMLLEILCLYAIYGVMENYLFSMSHNLFLLTLAYPIFRRELSSNVFAPTRIKITI